AAQVCAAAPASAECTRAASAAEEGQRLHEGFVSSYAASPFFPPAGSDAATALQARFDAFWDAIGSAGLAPLERSPLFAEAPADTQALQALLSDGVAGLGTGPLATHAGAWTVGDVELRAAARLLEGERA